TVPKVGYRFTAGVKKVGEFSTLVVEKRSRPGAAIEEEAPSDQDKQNISENVSGAASGSRVLRSKDTSRADYAALENQAAPVPAGAGSLLSLSRAKRIGVALLTVAALVTAALVYTLYFRGSSTAGQ